MYRFIPMIGRWRSRRKIPSKVIYIPKIRISFKDLLIELCVHSSTNFIHIYIFFEIAVTSLICFKIYYFYINILFIYFSNKNKLSYNSIFWVLLIFQKNIIHLSINLSINLVFFLNFSELLICMNGSIIEYNIFNKILFKMFISAFPILFWS